MAQIEISDTEVFFTATSPKKSKQMSNGQALKGFMGVEFNKTIEDVEWSQKDMKLLVDVVVEEVVEGDMDRFHKTAFKKLDWTKVAVGEFSGEQCQEQWDKIIRKVRKYRTAAEIISETRAVIPTITRNKHNNMKPPKDLNKPKKPTPPAFRYVGKHRETYKQQHPEVPLHLVQKALSEQYASLSEKKKLRYVNKYQTELEEWKIMYEEYLNKHPDRRVEVVKKPKLWTPVMLYVKEMTQKHAPDDEEGSSEEVKRLADKYRGKWNSGMSELRKVKFIRKALELDQQYQEDVKKYCQKHTTYQPTTRSVLSKAERKLMDKFDGKPEKPPPNGFFMFAKDIAADLTQTSLQQRSSEVAKKWKELSEDVRNGWIEKNQELKVQYLLELREYVDGLPEEEQTKYQAVLQKTVRKRKIKVEKQETVVAMEILETDNSD